MCEALAEAKHAKTALKLAKEMLTKFRAQDAKKEEAIVQEALTIVHLSQEAPEKAAKSIEVARMIAEELGEKRWHSRLLLEVASAHLQGKDHDAALEALEAALTIATDENDLHQVGYLQRELAYFHLFEKADYDEATKRANMAVDIAQRDEDKVAEAMANMHVAFCRSLTDDISGALEAAREAQELYEEAHFPWGEAQALWMLAELKAMDDKVDQAVELAEERLSIAREMRDLKMEASTLGLIASLHLKEKNHEPAEKVCKEALLLAQQVEDMEGEVNVQMLLLQIYLSKVHEPEVDVPSILAKAARTANEAVTMATKIGKKQLRGTALYWKAQVLLAEEKYQDAMRAAGEAEALFKGCQNQQGQAACLHVVGTLEVTFGNQEQAMMTLERAMALAQAAKDESLEYEVAQTIVHIQRQLAPQQQDQAAAVQQLMMPQQGMAPDGEGGGMDGSMVAAAPKGLDAAFVRKQLMRFAQDVMATDDELELDSPFMEAGLDSLSSVSLMSMVAKEFQMALSPSLVFDFPTVRALEDHLVEESKG